jgi:hypothetical protein
MIFVQAPTANPTQHDPHGPDDPLIKPSIIIIWIYQDIMGWISRTLAGEMAGADEDFGLEAEQQLGRLIFVQAPTANPTQHDSSHGPDDPLRTISYHHLDISGHDGMDEQEIGSKNGWC